MVCILNIIRAIQEMAVKELRDFIFKKYYRKIGFTKENSYYSMMHQKEKDLLFLATKFIGKNT